MKDYCSLVNVFQGCDAIDLPAPTGVAAAWRFIKGLCGNNTPGAALPFGRITACCYSAGYSSGYGRLMSNSHGPIGTLYARNKFKGIAHLQNDGTGYIDTFYNYAIVSPFEGALENSADARDFDNERACPGYYALRDALTNADCEVTVTPRAALSRIRFPGETGHISVNFSNDGLYDGGGTLRDKAGPARMKLVSENEIEVCARLHQLDMHFFLKAEGAKGGMRLWVDGKEIAAREIALEAGHTFGAVFDTGRDARLTLALSPKSAEIARRDARENTLSFDEAKARARETWNEVLSRVDAQFESARDAEIFYSNLYHSLIKPCDFEGESFLYDESEFVTEFATLWDQYKTSLPLIYTLYPDMARKIARTILHTARATKKMPHTFMLRGDYLSVTTTQARMLAEHTLMDAYLRGADFDANEAVRLSLADAFENGHFDDFMKNKNNAGNNAFVIDITDACAACARMARETGDEAAARRFDAVAARWPEVFDAKTGLLKDEAQFYEGTKWNYSFRLMHDMPGRMALAGGKEAFAALADRFFGFVHPEDETSCCFEGFNNETDMEAPYVYHFADRHDRLCEVMDAGLTSMFTTGRGGVPGNNDSGGLCALYVWNAIGVFPVSGQDLMIIGAPRAQKTRMRLANGNTFAVEKQGEGIYVKDACFRGEPLAALCIGAREMMRGGTLTLIMTDDAREARRA